MNGQPPKVSDARMAEALKLLKDSDSVELKFTVPDNDRYSVLMALDIDILNAEFRQVVFFDTPDLKLNRAGVVLRARRISKGGDTVIKLRPVVPGSLPRKLRRTDGFKIEVDVMPGNFVCSGSLKGKVANADVKKVLAGKWPVRKLFLPEQRALYKQYAPKGLDLDALRPLGPITVAKLKFTAHALDRRVAAAEMWFYPDGSRILELSTKCTRDDVFQCVGQTRAQLALHGLSLIGDQHTKTRRALDYFSRLQLRTKKR